MTTYNKYYSNGKTYQELYVYYRPANYYNALGYYSNTFMLIYYDGYGYNFYYGSYGYYEYSVHPRQKGSGGGGVVVFLCLCCCFICLIGYCIHAGKCQGGGESEGSFHESVHEEVVVEEVVVEHHDDPYPPPPAQPQF